MSNATKPLADCYIKETDLNLQKTIDICIANKATTKQMKSFTTAPTDEMSTIYHIHSNRQSCARCGTRHCQYNGKKYKIESEILDHSFLGLPTAIELNHIYTVEKQTIPDNNTEKYKVVFNGLRYVSDVLYHSDVDPSYQLVIHPPRQVPVMLWSKIQQELNDMESLKRSAHPHLGMVTIVKPNGTLHICVNPRDLNETIRHEHYTMQTIEQVVTRMP